MLELLYAWGVSGEDGKLPVYVGVRIPGISDYGITFDLQGFVKLSFQSIQLLVYEDEAGGKRDYQLCFRNFSLQALGLTFPPGKNHMYLFGKDGAKLGWYAAYQEEEKDGGSGDNAWRGPGYGQSD